MIILIGYVIFSICQIFYYRKKVKTIDNIFRCLICMLMPLVPMKFMLLIVFSTLLYLCCAVLFVAFKLGTKIVKIKDIIEFLLRGTVYLLAAIEVYYLW